MKKLLNKLNGWQRIYLILSVLFILLQCYVIAYEVVEDSWKIKKPSEELMRDASFSYEKYVRKQTYEQYLATYENEFKVFLENNKKDTLTNRITELIPHNPRDTYLPEYRAMAQFLRSKGVSVSKGLSLELKDKDESPIKYSIEYYMHGWYETMREQFPEYSKEFDTIDNSLKKENRYTAKYIKKFTYHYLIFPLIYFSCTILFLAGVYLLLVAMISLTRWVVAGFTS